LMVCSVKLSLPSFSHHVMSSATPAAPRNLAEKCHDQLIPVI
jgi:hypothetical protein